VVVCLILAIIGFKMLLVVVMYLGRLGDYNKPKQKIIKNDNGIVDGGAILSNKF